MVKNLLLNEKDLLDNFHKIKDFCIFSETGSTNEDAKRLINDMECPFCIIARSQSNGKGRLGRSFYSPKDTGVYFTLVLHAKQKAENILPITAISALSVCKSIKTLTGKDTSIKWINDVYSDDRKICGILCELISNNHNEPEYVIIGIGINLNSVFPYELKDIAGNIGPIDQNMLIASICDDIIERYTLMDKVDYTEEYRKLSSVLGKTIIYTQNGEKKEGVAKDICDDISLLVETEGGIIKLSSGEISVKIKSEG